MYKKISIIGAGGWGTALALLLAENRTAVRLWAHNPEVTKELVSQRTNEDYLPGVRLPPNVYATGNLADTLDADLMLLVPPSKALREVCGKLAGLGLPKEAVIVSCTKGLEHDTGKLMSEIIEEILPENPVAVLSGPNHAEEVAQRIPAAGVLGSKSPELLEPLQRVFSLPTFRAYTSDDVMGIQLGGALKNIFAIGAGVSDGFNMGDNAKAGLVTRALAEMMRLGIAMGGRRETFFGLSGVGDLMVTCFSRHSRNRKVGERLGRGESPAQIQESMQMVAEGIPTALSAWQVAQKLGIEAPITYEIYSVLYENKPPHEAMWGLLGRPPKPESDRDHRQG
ncbi:glycerol-3-phosphate dehydrogenase [Terrimicrobium sacchariphilum]|uniref:Glycerol-3-phosphate dehydrogenase [NAD(P)+] n=1 Tax=Terrimicrobium sacchariphilum TaxID=690879 RepID=A0A146G5U6_TERSA|nr:NAD(P)H-dependent glycerol-3-phosphate dehydrogenase [Terrimicrobium sacchariphilum]GAT33149.1 glycerol-3-phosphate dehydrogenase [Terrimicrobium sacchariphilum]